MKVEDIIDLKLQIKATADLVRTLNDIGSGTPAFRGIGVKYNQAKELYILDVQEIQEWYASLRFKEIHYRIPEIEKDKQKEIIKNLNCYLLYDWIVYAKFVTEKDESTENEINFTLTILTSVSDEDMYLALDDEVIEELNIDREVIISITPGKEVI